MENSTENTQSATPAEAGGNPDHRAHMARIARRKTRVDHEAAALAFTNQPYGEMADPRDEVELCHVPLGDLIALALCSPLHRLDGAMPSDTSFELSFMRTLGREVIAIANAMQISDCHENLSEEDVSLALHQVARRAFYGAELLGRRMDALNPDCEYWENESERIAVAVNKAVATIRKHVTEDKLTEAVWLDLSAGLKIAERFANGDTESEAPAEAKPKPYVSPPDDRDPHEPKVRLDPDTFAQVCASIDFLKSRLTEDVLGQGYTETKLGLEVAEGSIGRFNEDGEPIL